MAYLDISIRFISVAKAFAKHKSKIDYAKIEFIICTENATTDTLT